MPQRYPSLRTFRAVYIIPEHGTLLHGNECCICLDLYDDDAHGPVGVGSNRECEHVFGQRCLETYLDSTAPGRNTCPICRRKWYSRRSTIPSTPRDTNTSQVLSPPTQLRSSVRNGAESTHHRSPSGVDAQANRAVEQLISNIEALEALERREIFRLGQDIRVRLQQVEGRIRAFLERNVTADVSFVPVLRHRTRTVLQSTMEAPTTHRHSTVGAESDSDHHLYPHSSAGVQSSTIPSPELRLPEQRPSQQAGTSTTAIPHTPEHHQDSATVARRSSQVSHATASPILMTGLRTEDPSLHGYRHNVMLPQPSSQIRQEVNARGLRDHLRTFRYDRSRNTTMQASGPRLPLSDIAGMRSSIPLPTSSRTSISEAMNGVHTNQHVWPPAQNHDHAIEHAPTLPPRYETSNLFRTHSTQGFVRDAQPVGISPAAAPMSEWGAGLRSPVAASRGLSRIMSMSKLRDFVAGTRTT